MITGINHITLSVKDIKEAFNQTQKEMRAKYDPYYWAAFVLIEQKFDKNIYL